MEYSIVGYLGYKEGVGDIVFENEQQFAATAKAAVEHYRRRELLHNEDSDIWWEIEECIVQACADNGVQQKNRENTKIVFNSHVA